MPARLGFLRRIPRCDDVPAELAEFVFDAQVAVLVAGDLGGPPLAAGGREAEIRAMFMAVPEAAMDEDNGSVAGQDEIGPAGELLVFRPVQGEAVAMEVEQRTDDPLRPCVGTADAGHDLGALLGSEDVGHER